MSNYVHLAAVPHHRVAAIAVSGRVVFCLPERRQGQDERKLVLWTYMLGVQSGS